MHLVFVVISKDIIRRNILDTPFWSTFIREAGDAKITLVVDQQTVDDVRKKYERGNIYVIGYTKQKQKHFQKFLNFLIRTGINSHSTRTYRNRALKRGDSSLGAYIWKSLLANIFGRFDWYKRFLRFLYLNTKSPKEVYDIFDKYNPETVFAPSMIDNEFDANFARVAKQRNCKVIGMVRSWDNLNNHGVLSVVPDVWYFQNSFLKEMAVKMQGIDLTNITTEIVGLPHYDAYHNAKEKVMDRESFIKQYGLDERKKIIMVGGSDFYYSEDKLPSLLNDAVEKGLIKQPVQIVFRPHPSKLFPIEAYNLDKLSHIKLNDAFSGQVKFNDSDFFLNLMYHSDVIINIASTLSIDAAVLDRPVVCVNFDDPKRKLTYYESVNRLYDHFDHYEKLVATGGVRVSGSIEKLISDINDYLGNPSLDRQGRAKIVETFVAPFDGQASVRLAHEVLKNVGEA